MSFLQINDLAVRNGFVVFPVCTDLQHIGTGRVFANATAVVLVDGARIIKGEDEIVQANAFGWSVLCESLRPFCRGDSGNLIFVVWCRGLRAQPEVDGVWPASSILMLALKQLGRDAGFREVDVDVGSPPDDRYANDWDRAVTDFAPTPSDLQAHEPALGDERVKLYPVRTRLSRLLYCGADCVAHLIPPIENLDTTAAAETIKRSLSELRLERKGRLVFVHNWEDVAAANSQAVVSACVKLWHHNEFGFAESLALCWQYRGPNSTTTDR